MSILLGHPISSSHSEHLPLRASIGVSIESGVCEQGQEVLSMACGEAQVGREWGRVAIFLSDFHSHL